MGDVGGELAARFSALTLSEPDPLILRLLALPAELISGIFERLDDESLRHYQLVSWQMADASMFAHGIRFFGCRIAITHPFSLGILLDIACHPTLSTYVRMVTISGEHEPREQPVRGDIDGDDIFMDEITQGLWTMPGEVYLLSKALENAGESRGCPHRQCVFQPLAG